MGAKPVLGGWDRVKGEGGGWVRVLGLVGKSGVVKRGLEGATAQ